MTIHKKQVPRKKFKIEVELNSLPRWAREVFRRELKVSVWAINHFYDKWARTMWKRIDHTNAFNKAFNTKFNFEELFSLVD